MSYTYGEAMMPGIANFGWNQEHSLRRRIPHSFTVSYAKCATEFTNVPPTPAGCMMMFDFSAGSHTLFDTLA